MVSDRLEAVEVKQTDEKGLLNEVLKNIRSDNASLKHDLNAALADIAEKSNKIRLFEAKLNKWIRLFEDSE